VTSRRALILFGTVYGLLAAGLAWVAIRQYAEKNGLKGVVATAGAAYFAVRIALMAARVRRMTRSGE
jgi:hypothetical protein